MDTDGDGRVDLSEFLAFMRQQGYLDMHNPSFFNVLDHDDNGTLDFAEVMTLYYIIKSGRPFCNSCKNFIPGIFFSCVECFKNPKKPFNICHDCYRFTKCKHDHNGRVQFLDNYTLLEAIRDPSLVYAIGLNSNQTGITTSNGNVQVPQVNVYMNTTYPACMNTTYPTHMNTTYPICPPSPTPNYSNAIVPTASTMGKWNIALTALETALSIGNISSTMCTIL
ncbi:hypothetical protein CDL12_25297 [Handroanthus impetiginosus]|uniref:EF-hand domain-containing protein n=1 Tax=Handroanthus impetiginosus TaxID=429701 RepID=A0A2G9GA76_9LAMI|nr:hypothetical protein CDL12_25297 [Handroanthus impetiginosus]